MSHIERVLSAHLDYLSRTIGPRPAGSAANRVVAGYIERVLAACGFTVELQPYHCPAWEDLGARLEIAGDVAEVGANAFSPSCDVQAPVVVAGTLAELRAARLAGCVAVLYGQLAAAPLAPRAWPHKGELDTAIVAALEAGQPAAVLAVQRHGPPLVRLIEDPELAIPSATVPAEVGLALVRQPGVPVHLQIAARRGAGNACNVIGRRGAPDVPRVVLCAHFDTKIDTPGAADNAAGVAVLLALAELLGAHHLAVGLELVAFNGEEYLPSGAEEYARRRGADFEPIIAALNFDGVGQWLAPNSITLLAGSPAFEAALRGLIVRYPGVVWVAPWIESDHAIFALRGVPSVAFTTAARQPLDHSRADTAEWVSPARLREAAMLGAEIVATLQHKPASWTRADAAVPAAG